MRAALKKYWVRFSDSKYHDWVEENSRWHRLKALGSSSLVRASVLMPAFGYMLLLNDNVHEYVTIKYDGWLLEYLPSVWRVWFLFYGSFLLALATILYTVFCPTEIKQYSNEFEMAETEAKHHIKLNEASRVQAQVKWVYENMPVWMYPYFDLNNVRLDKNIQTVVDPTGSLANVCILHWRILDMWHRGLRFFLFFIYGLGLTLVAIPAIFTFLQVTSIPIRRLFP